MNREEPAPQVHVEAAIGRVHLSDFTIDPGVRVPEHAHDAPHICVVLDGGFEEAQTRGSQWCAIRSFRLSPPGDIHRIRIGNSRMRCIVIGMDGDDIPSFERRVYASDTDLNGIVAQIRAMFCNVGHASPLIAESLTLELFAQVARYSGGPVRAPRPQWLTTILEMIHDSTGAPPTLSALGAAVERHPVHLARVFREHLGAPIGMYAQRLQLERARRQIILTEESIASIAFAAGFADQSHLTRLMRRTLGVTPARLRVASRAAAVISHPRSRITSNAPVSVG